MGAPDSGHVTTFDITPIEGMVRVALQKSDGWLELISIRDSKPDRYKV